MEGAGMNITVVSHMDSADLFKIALDERLGTPSVGGVGATPDTASASATGN
jgi:hypothetical protein